MAPRLPVVLGFLFLFGLKSLLRGHGHTADSERQAVPLDAGWAFHLGEAAGAQASAFDDRGWRRVDLPHDWSIEGSFDPKAPGGGQVGFLPTGVGWYRRALAVPESWNGRRVEIVFDGIYMNSEVWLDGVRLGRHPYGYTPIRYDLTPLLHPGNNVLAVRVDNSTEPNSRWYSGSGIYRHVRLEVTGAVRIAPEGVFLRTLAATPESAAVRAEFEVQNRSAGDRHAEVEISLADPEGRPAGAAIVSLELPAGADRTAASEFTVAHPELWSPDSPRLYRASVRLRSGREDADFVTVRTGLRTVQVSAERGFELNGAPLKLIGGSAHHDNGVLGAAAFDRAEERRVELLKAAGFNAVRTAHNPPSPAFLDACDRLGLLVMDEAFDCWEKGKNPHDYSVNFKEWWQRDLDAMVRRDRNHPAVVFWSIGNEVYERGDPAGGRIARMLTAEIRRLDPGRPLTAGINGLGSKGDWTRLDPLFAALDVAGYNYEIARAPADHARLPRRVIVATESYAGAAFENWSAVQRQPYVIGEFVWSGMDYLGEAGIGRIFPPGEKVLAHWQGDMWPWHGAECGDLDLTGWRRPLSHYRNILWRRGERLYAAVREPAPGDGAWGLSKWAQLPALPSWTWPGREGKPLTVEVYSRCDSVRLLLNGREVGEQATGEAQEFKADFTVPYAPGELRVVGMLGGRDADSFVLRTAGPIAGLRLMADRTVLSADGQDLAFVTAEAVDGGGRWIPAADAAVQFTLEGPGSLAGIGNADLTSLEPYRANPHRLFQGRALAVIRTQAAAGALRLRAGAAGAAPATIELQAR